jgi:transcription termination/antitermination protein NusG
MTALLQIGDFVCFMDSCDVSLPIPKLWYLLRIVPNREMTVTDRLRDRGISIVLPLELSSARGAFGRRVLRQLPLFSGIAFVADFDARLRRLRELADGIIGFVTFGDEVAAATPKTMSEVRAFEAKMQLPYGQRKYALSQKVRVVDGSFNWWEGPIERLDSHGRLRVLLDVLGRQVPVILDETQIEPV